MAIESTIKNQLSGAFVFIFLLCGCVTFEMPVPTSSGGDWQRPLDLQLQPLPSVRKTESSKTLLDGSPKGSLSGLILKIDCGHWNEVTQTGTPQFTSIINSVHAACENYKQEFTRFGAQLKDTSESLRVSLYLGDAETYGCGLSGWYTFFSFGYIPCKSEIGRKGQLQIRSSSNTLLAYYPLQFRSVQYLGWASLFSKGQSKKINTLYEQRLTTYMINQTYTQAVKHNLLMSSSSKGQDFYD